MRSPRPRSSASCRTSVWRSDFRSRFSGPNLVIPIHGGTGRAEWGEIGSRVRGWCYWNELERGFGYLRFLTRVGPGLWFTDARHPDSPYETAYFRNSSLPEAVRPASLPSRNYIFEFEVGESERADGLQAVDMELVSKL